MTTRPDRRVAPRRHEHRLGRRAGPVVEAGVGNVHAGQLGDERLILEDRLERPLAGLGLIGSVGRVELAAGGDEIDHRGDEVVVGSAAEEARRLAGGHVAGGQIVHVRRSVPIRPSPAATPAGDRAALRQGPRRRVPRSRRLRSPRASPAGPREYWECRARKTGDRGDLGLGRRSRNPRAGARRRSLSTVDSLAVLRFAALLLIGRVVHQFGQ